MSDPRTEPDDLDTDLRHDAAPDDPDTALVEEVSIDGMCGVY